MVVETELRHQQGIAVLDIVQYRALPLPFPEAIPPSSSATKGIAQPLDPRSSDPVVGIRVDTKSLDFLPKVRSGSFADIGHRSSMEDEHICIDDLSAYMGSTICCPTPSAFFGVFDGHGGADAAIYLRKHATEFFFNDEFPHSNKADDIFLQKVELSLSKAFIQVDGALADDFSVSSSSGTTGLTALIFGRVLMVANVGDCRAVLCRKGEAINMSEDHRQVCLSERIRVEAAGGYFDDGYLNGFLSVTRALGDWDLKFPRGPCSALIAEPEFRQVVLTEDDEFLIIGCDGIWDVMSSQHAVSIVRKGLRRHNDPAKCARELVLEALRLNTSDNLTVIVVCFFAEQTNTLMLPSQQQPSQRPRLRCCSLSAEALCTLSSWLNNDEDGLTGRGKGSN